MIRDEVWDDDWFYDLDPIEKLVWFFLLTNNRCNIAGVYKLNQKWAARMTGLDADLFPKIINRFVEDKKLYLDGDWVVILNFTKHQTENPSVKQGIIRILEGVPRDVMDRLSQAVPDCPTLPYLTSLNSEKISDNKDMSWNQQSDDYEEGVVDLETGELHDPVAEKKDKDKEQNVRFRKAIDWLIEHQGRDPNRTPVPKQLKAIKQLYQMGISAQQAKQEIIQAESSDYWRGKDEKPDFWTVVSIIQKRG